MLVPASITVKNWIATTPKMAQFIRPYQNHWKHSLTSHYALSSTERDCRVVIEKRDIIHLYSHIISVVSSVQMAIKLVEFLLGNLWATDILLFPRSSIQHQCDVFPSSWSCLVQSISVHTCTHSFDDECLWRWQSTTSDTHEGLFGTLQFLESWHTPFCYSWYLSQCNKPSGLCFVSCTLSICIDVSLIFSYWTTWH